MTKTVQRDGVKGLYWGLSACYMKVIPMTGLLFVTNEKVKKLMGVH